MPELLEAYYIAKELQTIKNQFIINYKINEHAKINGIEHLQLPSQIIEITTYGKKLIITLEHVLIIFSFGMSGKILFEPKNHSHVKLELTNTVIYFDDARRFGKIDIIKHEDKTAYFSKFGPCLLPYLNDPMPSTLWCQHLKLGKRKIIDILTDQHVFSGLGWYLSTDILYAAKIHPLRLGNTLSNDEIEALRISTHQIVLSSYQQGGFTLLDYITPLGNIGKYQPLIYGKDIDAFGNKVRHKKFNGRTIHYVRKIQK